MYEWRLVDQMSNEVRGISDSDGDFTSMNCKGVLSARWLVISNRVDASVQRCSFTVFCLVITYTLIQFD